MAGQFRNREKPDEETDKRIGSRENDYLQGIEDEIENTDNAGNERYRPPPKLESNDLGRDLPENQDQRGHDNQRDENSHGTKGMAKIFFGRGSGKNIDEYIADQDGDQRFARPRQQAFRQAAREGAVFFQICDVALVK